MLTRRKFLYTGGGAAVGMVLVGGDGFLESNRVEIKRVDIPLPIPEAFDGFTIAHLSDFHYEDHFSVLPIRKAVQLVSRLHPDLIALTGDFVSVSVMDFKSRRAKRAARNAEPCAEILGGLQAPAGKFAVLGNHDAASDPQRIVSTLHSHGISALMNRAVPLERGSSRIWLAGIDDVLEGRPDLGAALTKVPLGEPVILLAHEPDFADEVSLAPVKLQLSGHSHGGQIWLPGIGAPWLPTMGMRYPRGLYQVRNLKLYTNFGIGTIRVPIRLNCTPEVTLITLRSVHT